MVTHHGRPTMWLVLALWTMYDAADQIGSFIIFSFPLWKKKEEEWSYD